MIEVDLPDGTVAEFPDGTPPDVIKRALQRKFGVPQQAAPQPQVPDNIRQEADAYEAVRGNGTFADMTDASMRGLPFSDEITSGIGAPFRAAGDWMSGRGFDLGRAYDEKMQVEEELRRRREERSPVASTVGEVAGGMAMAAPVAKAGYSLLNGAKATLPSLAGRGAAEAGIYGGIYNAGEGRGLDERLSNATRGAAVGAAVGGATGFLARIGANKTAAAPAMDDLRAAGQAAYDRAEKAGVVFTPTGVDKLRGRLIKDFTDFGFLPETQPGAAAALKAVDRLKGQNVTLKGLDSVRKAASNAYIPGNKSNNALVSKIVKRIDDLVQSPAQSDILLGNAKAGAQAIGEARSMWSRLAKAEKLQSAVERAELRAASTGSGGNYDNAVRQNARRLLEKEHGYTPGERAALEKIARGTKGQNAMRLAGKLSPQGNGLMAALGVGGAMVNPTIGIASLTGLGAKSLAEGMTGRNVAAADALFRNGGPLAQLPLSAIRRMAVEALSHSGGQLAPRYTTP